MQTLRNYRIVEQFTPVPYLTTVYYNMIEIFHFEAHVSSWEVKEV